MFWGNTALRSTHIPGEPKFIWVTSATRGLTLDQTLSLKLFHFCCMWKHIQWRNAHRTATVLPACLRDSKSHHQGPLCYLTLRPCVFLSDPVCVCVRACVCVVSCFQTLHIHFLTLNLNVLYIPECILNARTHTHTHTHTHTNILSAT